MPVTAPSSAFKVIQLELSGGQLPFRQVIILKNDRSVTIVRFAGTPEKKIATMIGHATAPEIRRMGTAQVLCLYGSDEGDSPCRQLGGPTVTVAALAGGHHFGGDYAALARLIIEHARPSP